LCVSVFIQRIRPIFVCISTHRVHFCVTQSKARPCRSPRGKSKVKYYEMKWIGFDLFSFDVFFDLTLSFYFCLLLFVVFLIVGSPLPSPLVGCYWCWCMFLVPWIFCCCFRVCVPFFLCLSVCLCVARVSKQA